MSLRKFVDVPSDIELVRIPFTSNKYFASKKGKIYSAPKLGNGGYWVELTPGLVGGYYNVKVFFKGKQTTCIAHRLIALTFLPNPFKKTTVNHKDGNKINNDISNLEWATRKENTQHAYDTGLKTSRGGELNGLSKITNKEAIEISKSNLKLSELSLRYNINKSSVSAIRTGRLWSHITGIKFKPTFILNEKVVLEIFNSDLSGKCLSEKYGVSQQAICDIKKGRNWRRVTNNSMNND